MVHRDLKIGLVVGLVLVAAIVIKFATDPKLSPEARWDIDGIADSRDNADSNSVSGDYMVSETALDSGQSELMSSARSGSDIAGQNDRLSDLPASRQARSEGSSLQGDGRSEPGLQERVQDSTGDYSSAYRPDEAPLETAVARSNEQASSPAVSAYDNAEIIRAQRFHIVAKNQTLSDIARIYYHSANQWQRIVDANPQIKDPNRIKAGMKLIIPWEDE